MFRHFFSREHNPEIYSVKDIEEQLHINRKDLIDIAILSGSDYTPGIYGVGPVTSIEILSEFKSLGVNQDTLISFRNWLEEAKAEALSGVREHKKESSLLKRLRGFKNPLVLPLDFPDAHARDAYLHPLVDRDDTAFHWYEPKGEALRQFASSKFSWTQEQTDKFLSPVLKAVILRKSQKEISDYMKKLPLYNEIRSVRVRRAVEKSKGRMPYKKQPTSSRQKPK